MPTNWDSSNHPRSAGTARLSVAELAERVAVAVLVGLLILSLGYVAFRGVHVLLEAFAGILFAVFLNALSDWLSRGTGIRYGISLGIVFVALLLMAAGLGWFLADRVAGQLVALSQTVPQSLQQIQERLQNVPWGKSLLEQLPFSGDSAGRFAFGSLGSIISSATSVMEAILVILLVGIFGAADPDLYCEGILHVVPHQHRRRLQEAIDAVGFNLRWWLVGQVSLMIMIGITTWLGLTLIGVKLALVLGLIAGVLELVPYIGAWLAAVPAALIALMEGPTTLVAVLGLYLFLHILEGYVLVPLVQQKAVLMPPIVTLVGQILLGELLGFMGLFVAAPLTVSLVVLVKMLYVEDTLGDEAVDVPGEPGNEEKPVAQEREAG